MRRESTPLLRRFKDDPMIQVDVRTRARHVILFKEQFANLVSAGVKRQTIRPPRDRPVKIGDWLDLRQWIGVAYRSRQRELAHALCTDTFPVTVSGTGITLYTAGLAPHEYDSFAIRDGFTGFSEMRAWFEREHGLPFDGVCICWHPLVPVSS